jgi:hypothetical protein
VRGNGLGSLKKGMKCMPWRVRGWRVDCHGYVVSLLGSDKGLLKICSHKITVKSISMAACFTLATLLCSNKWSTMRIECKSAGRKLGRENMMP